MTVPASSPSMPGLIFRRTSYQSNMHLAGTMGQMALSTSTPSAVSSCTSFRVIFTSTATWRPTSTTCKFNRRVPTGEVSLLERCLDRVGLSFHLQFQRPCFRD